jgi:3-hydroxyisobutyrate dehydrogenase
MGAPMATCLLDGPEPLAVYDAVAARREQLAAAGAVAAATAADAARDAEALFVMVVDEAQCRDVLLGPEGAAAALRPGAVVVLMSTVGPDAVRRLAAGLAEVDVTLVDAPVSGGVARAGAGDLLIMASGPPEALERVRPALDLMGSTVVVCGQTAGDGQSVKLVNQLLCGVHIAAAAEALAYAQALGLDPAAVHETVRHGAAGSFMLDDRGARMVGRNFTPVKSALDIFVKDLGLVTSAAAAQRFPATLASAANQLFLMGSALGHGGEDDSGLLRVYEQWTSRSRPGPDGPHRATELPPT